MDSHSTNSANSVSEFSNTILKDFDSANSVGLESKIATLEKIIIDQNTKIGDFDVERQQLKSSIAEMGKNYAALQKDNQMWKNQYKCLVKARIKFETEEFNILRSAHADKLRETSELNLELATCQNQLESTKDILQKTNEYKNSLLEEKIRLERKCRETSDELSKASIVASNLKNKCKEFQDEAENLAQKLKDSMSSGTTLLSACKRVQEQNETLQLSLNSKDHIIQSYMNSCSKLTKEKDQLLQELSSLKLKKINPHKEDVLLKTDEDCGFEDEEVDVAASDSYDEVSNSPLPVRDYCAPNLVQGQRYSLMLHKVLNPNRFYIRLIGSGPGSEIGLASFVKRFNQYYNQSGNCWLLEDFNPGCVCVTYWAKHFYRSRIIYCQTDTVTVRFVDYGLQYTVPKNDVYEISDEFLQEPVFSLISRSSYMFRTMYNNPELRMFRKIVKETKVSGVLINNKNDICEWTLYDQVSGKSIAQCFRDSCSALSKEAEHDGVIYSYQEI